MTPSIYINLEDDVSAVAERLKREKARQVILVCPKRCLLFSDPINLKLLKTQADVLDKEIFILTMDEKGRSYAQAAGFGLRDLPRPGRSHTISDVKKPVREPVASVPADEDSGASALVSSTVQGIKSFAKAIGIEKPAERATPVEPKVKAPVVRPTVSSSVNRNALPGEAVTEEDFESDIPETAVRDTIFPKGLEEKFKAEKQSRIHTRVVGTLVGLTLAVLLMVVFVVLPKATVAVYPKTEPVTRDMDISMNTSVQAPDSNQLVMPAVKITESPQASDKFEAQGKQEVGTKADGTVKIYNFTKLPINLKSATTILSVNGKSYTLIPDLVTIKPTRYSNPQTKEIDPSSVGDSVEVVAAQGGESFNLPAGTRLEITNQVFGSKPQYLYAKSDTPITGGVSRYLSVVSADDLTNAENSLKQNIIEQVRSKLAVQGLVLLDNAYSVQVTNFASDKLAGAQSPTFNAQMSATVTGLAFNKDNLSQLIFDRVKQTVSENKTLQPDSDLAGSFKVKSIDLNAQTAVISAHFQSSAVYNVNIKGLPQQLTGKTESEVNEILMSKPEIDRIDVTMAPSWQKTFPWFAQKIYVQIQQ